MCASHSHRPNSFLPVTFGVDTPSMYARKSSAQVQHGYRRPKRRRNDARSACSELVARDGYCAAMVCRSVQPARPSVSLSAGQSDGGCGMAATAAVEEEEDGIGEGELAVVVLLVDLFCLGRSDLVCAAHAANEVHDRHLWAMEKSC